MPKKPIAVGKDKEKENRYTYRFQVPDSKTYDISYIKIRKNTEAIRWNLIDNYICIQGNGSLTPSECKKCWRQRIYLIPIMYASAKQSSGKHATFPLLNQLDSTSTLGNAQTSPTWCNSSTEAGKPTDFGNNSSMFMYNIQSPGMVPASMLEGRHIPVHCDIYQRKSSEELSFFRDYYFIKFMEGLNKLNRADDRRVFSKAALAYSEIYNSSTK